MYAKDGTLIQSGNYPCGCVVTGEEVAPCLSEDCQLTPMLVDDTDDESPVVYGTISTPDGDYRAFVRDNDVVCAFVPGHEPSEDVVSTMLGALNGPE